LAYHGLSFQGALSKKLAFFQKIQKFKKKNKKKIIIIIISSYGENHFLVAPWISTVMKAWQSGIMRSSSKTFIHSIFSL
jgi:hypothetical protein